MKDILRLVPTIQSINLLEMNMSKNKSPKDIIKKGTMNILGTTFIKEESDFIESF